MSPDRERRDDDKLDETIDETFPASDPPANTVETGVRIGEVPPAPVPPITDNAGRSRLELTVDGQTAFLDYRRARDTFSIIHTEVPPELRGRRLGDALVEAALRQGRSEGLRIVIVCPFARAYLRRHPPFPDRRHL
ncbi:MAG TPA: GNAT family N-acetyltransferase [Vicinamibacterales bacterium]|nr:GNAT family N-acetyltransferase [Vicinamibacterales bacterium]